MKGRARCRLASLLSRNPANLLAARCLRTIRFASEREETVCKRIGSDRVPRFHSTAYTAFIIISTAFPISIESGIYLFLRVTSVEPTCPMSPC